MGKTALGPAKDGAASQRAWSRQDGCRGVTGRERCSGLSSNGHRRPLGAACMPGTRLQVAGTKAVGILFPLRGVGRIRTSVTEKGPTCPHPPKKPPAHFPSAERLLPKLGFFLSQSLGRSVLSSHFTEI